MATSQAASINWSASYTVAPHTSKTLPGDKILLPQSALEQLLAASTVTVPSSRPTHTAFDPFNPYSLQAARQEQAQWRETQQQLPHPLTFRLVNSKNGNTVYAGIREFSAEEGEVVLSPFLMEALGISEDELRKRVINPDTDGIGSSDAPIILPEDEAEGVKITVHAKQLPKGTYVRLRPLEAGYDPEDWKSLLERHLRENFTTLTNGGIMSVPGSKSEQFRFLIDKFLPDGDGICVVDTDLEVDIEALNEEQARETMRKIMQSRQRAPGTAEGSSVGGPIDIWNPAVGQVIEDEYVDYQLSSWDKSQGIDIELTLEDGEDVDLFVSPQSNHQRARPRAEEHVFGDMSSKSSKRIQISASNIELEGAESIFISVHAFKAPGMERSGSAKQYTLRVQSSQAAKSAGQHSNTPATEDTDMHGPDEEQCKNCHQWVPKRTMVLHENFCLRNNILCPHCSNVFKKSSQEWNDHWHCPYDSEYGNTPSSKIKHDSVSHTPLQCPNCPYEGPNLTLLARHRTTSLISGLTAHELADGSRTTECHLCFKIVRLRDMATHLKHHEIEKTSRSKPQICRNVNCGRTLEGVGKNGEIGAATRMGQGPGNDLGLCSICFGPLYVSMHDPEGKAMKRRIERRYLSQLIQGCGKPWCANPYCKTAQAKDAKRGSGTAAALTTKDALPIVKPLVDAVTDRSSDMYFCVDEGSQKRRGLAEMIAAERVYDLEWCIAALEAEGGSLDGARTWLENWAPKKGA
ncbi:hypothetical protein F5884DRAFT_705461 [Xylogone sp. PMI_703]|nr:hypothetical protein F5884DRAFT_705461 [Xylogone sp. PMI_703]